MFTRKMVVRLLLCNAFVAAWLALGLGAPAQAAEPLRIVVLGDSLVAASTFVWWMPSRRSSSGR